MSRTAPYRSSASFDKLTCMLWIFARLRKIRVGILQHRILISMSELLL